MGKVEQLKEGNERFRNGKSSQKDFMKMVEETKERQNPYAIILTCSDSRVVPEHIFDVGIGELFVVRTAGNVVSEEVLGSIEYAAEHLHAPLLIVMGHTKCGAVQACWNDVKENNHITKLVEKIRKAVERVKEKNGDMEDAVVENIKLQIEEILSKSALCKKLQEEGKLKIVGALYHIENGKVEII